MRPIIAIICAYTFAEMGADGSNIKLWLLRYFCAMAFLFYLNILLPEDE